MPAKLEESKVQKLRDFFSQVQAIKQAAMPPAPPQMPGALAPGQPIPQAAPEPMLTSPLVPNGPGIV